MGVLLKKVSVFVTKAAKAGLFLLAISVAAHQALQAQSSGIYTPPSVAPSEPLSGIRYNAKWELYGGPGFAHFKAGPNLIQGANLGGLDLQASRWFTRHWAAEASIRGYYGTSAPIPNPDGIHGPFVAEHFAVAGAEYRLPSNEHASITLHALAGGAHGLFDKALGNVPPGEVGFYSNQFTFGSLLGGSIDLNRSPKLAFRISPDATITRFGSEFQEQFAISVGIVYRIGHIGPAAK